MREREQSHEMQGRSRCDLAIGGMVVDTGFLGRTYEAFVSNKGNEISVLGSWSEIGEFFGHHRLEDQSVALGAREEL